MGRRRLVAVGVAGLVLAMGVPVLAGALSAPPRGANGVATAAAVTTTTQAPNVAAANVKLMTYATGLDSPVALAWRLGDARMYVAEQGGKVVIVANGTIVSTVLDITANVTHGSEQGLLGLTFTRDGTKMYIFFTDVNGAARIVEFAMSGDHPNLATRRLVLIQGHPNFDNHNGGEVMIGRDNMLYIGFGDGGGSGDPSGHAQSLTTLAGKIARIDPRPTATAPYRIPANNPFVNRTGVRREIWMYGLRNPWRFSQDMVTNDVWIGDVGQALYEEIDFAKAGQSGINWGWNKREGFHPYQGGAQPAGARNPILERPHTAGDCAITGGYVYRGNAIAHLNGAYIFGDFCTGKLRAVAQVDGRISQRRDLGLTVAQLSSFGQGPYGGVYAVSHAGTIYVLAPGP